MLLRLVIRNVVLIEALELNFGPGLTVFTGETGAGKSILLDALGLALGQRGDPSLIRQGSDQASVMAEFSATEPWLSVLLAEHGLEVGETLMLRRVLQSQGASRAYINDQPVGVALLKLIGDQLLEVHGQFDRLLTPTSHRQTLDVYGHINTSAVVKAYEQWQEKEKAYHEAELQQARIPQDIEFLTVQVAELVELRPLSDEEVTLLAERQRLAQGQRVEDALSQGATEIEASLTPLYTAEKALQRIQELLGTIGVQATSALGRAIIEVNETAALVTQMQRDYQHNPARLAEIEDRLQAIRALARKYGVKTEELPGLLQRAQQQLEELSYNEDDLKILEQGRDQARGAYVIEAQVLHQQRRTAATQLIHQINRELPSLKLEHARFEVGVMAGPLETATAQGIDTVEFQVSTNPGQPATSLAKVASGGELSRLMLALKVALAQQHQLNTLVFDEIDQGVGGAVSAAVGERLARLAKNLQILVITHSPQVAAFGNQHFEVKKALSGQQMVTDVAVLSSALRREELARMLSGEEITAEARAAAGRLMQG